MEDAEGNVEDEEEYQNRRNRYDPMATVIERDSDGEYRPHSPEDVDPMLFIGADDAVEEEDNNEHHSEESVASAPGLLDKGAIELVARLSSLKCAETEDKITEDIYPSDVSEFTDYLKRNKITALRTLVRSVFSCPKV